MSDLLPNFPDCLKARRAWVCWRSEVRHGRLTKVPYNPATGTEAKSNDPSTWTDYDTACGRAGGFDGLGIMFDNGLCGVDLDHCRDAQSGMVEPWAQEIVEALNSYSEVSPSGTGLHVLLWGELPPGGKRKGDVEMYDAGRYFTVSGQRLEGVSPNVEARQEEVTTLHRRLFGERPRNAKAAIQAGPTDLTDTDVLAKARSAANGPEFSRLWAGGYPDDDSAGDLALCNSLAFWTGGDEARIDALFRQSGRMRAKWDEKRGATTYGERTIRKALEMRTEFYQPQRKRAGRTVGTDAPGGRRDGHEVISTARLAEAILERDVFAVDEGLSLYWFDGGCYAPRGERRIKARVKHLMNDLGYSTKWTSRKQEEVAEYVRVDAPRLEPVPPPDTLNCENGLLDLKTAELRPHSPDFLSPIQLPVVYDPRACCSAWLRFVEQTFPGDCQDLPWELAAWLMAADTSIQKAVLLLGEGSNGKSAFLAALTAFLGRHNCANVSLHKLESDRFAAARLVGKLANICPDLPAAHLVGTSVFKAITGGDSLDAERKYGEGFSFTPYSRLIFSANHPPQSPDASHAFFRRWLCVPFTRTFEGKTARPRGELDAELADPIELSGVLNLALAALPRVRLGGITETASMREAWAEFRTITDPIAVWLDRETVADPNAVIPKHDLLRAYNSFCVSAGKAAMIGGPFGKALRRLRPDLQEGQRTIAGEKVWVYLGIGLRADRRQNAQNG